MGMVRMCRWGGGRYGYDVRGICVVTHIAVDRDGLRNAVPTLKHVSVGLLEKLDRTPKKWKPPAEESDDFLLLSYIYNPSVQMDRLYAVRKDHRSEKTTGPKRPLVRNRRGRGSKKIFCYNKSKRWSLSSQRSVICTRTQWG